MKKLLLLPIIFVFTVLIISCSSDEDGEFATVAIPITQSIADFRASVKIQDAKNISESGKIYAWQDYIFINDRNEGVHIIDNTNPSQPVNIKFIKIPGNTDVAIKGSTLYANSGMDLVTFNIQNINNIQETARIENVFPNYYYAAPVGADFVDFKNFDHEDQVIVGYVMESRKIESVATDGQEWGRDFLTSENAAFDGASGTGTGGSMARFSIRGNYLYVADQAKVSTFDISNKSSVSLVNAETFGWDIETIFNYEDHLYLGSATGLHILSIENPAAPSYVSYLQHVQGCDPVVVKNQYAYVTIRGGNECGQNFNQLDVVNIEDKTTPFVEKTFEMSGPYGLGIKDKWLFVCDGNAGLKIYDIENTPDLKLIDQFSNVNTYDVIPLEERLLMVGDNTLYQYSYKGNEINLISTFALN